MRKQVTSPVLAFIKPQSPGQGPGGAPANFFMEVFCGFTRENEKMRKYENKEMKK